MATARKAAPMAAKTTTSIAAPAKAAKAVKSAAKAPAKNGVVSKVAKAIVKLAAKIVTLTGRKDKISADINALKDQRGALKALAAAVAAPVAAAPKAKTAPAKKAAAKAA